MKRGGVHIHPRFPKHRGKALFQLSGRLVGKGDCQNVKGLRRLLAQRARQLHRGFAALLHKAFQLLHLLRIHRLRYLPAVVRVAEPDQICDAIDKHRCFSAARSRKDQQRPLCGKYRFPLHGVQAAELRLDVLAAQSAKSFLAL